MKLRITNTLFFTIVLFYSLYPHPRHTGNSIVKPISIQDSIENLYTLAKTYGYIKYFYPGDELAELDWNRFAFYAVQKSLSSSDMRACLETMVSSLAPAVHFFPKLLNENKYITNEVPSNSMFSVFWQHLGDGHGSVGKHYQSMRINRPARVLPGSSNDFSGIRHDLNKDELRGKEIKLSVQLKATDIYNGVPSLILNIKEHNKPLRQLSTQGQGITNLEWTEHFINTLLPDSLENVSITVQSIGLAGGLAIHNIQLNIKENNNWINGFSSDFNELNDSTFKLKWKQYGDNQIIRLTKSFNNTYVVIERTKGRLKNISPIYSTQVPDHNWITEYIGSGLKIHFPLVLPGDHSHTYPIPDQHKLEALLHELETIHTESMVSDNVHTRLANVIILWNSVQHFSPALHYMKLDWDIYLKKAIKASFYDKTMEDHRATLSQMLNPLKDSHATVYYSVLLPPIYYPPIKWEWIQKKLVITQVVDSTLHLNRGDVVTKINDIRSSTYWSSIKEHVAGATESRKNYMAINESLAGKKESILKLDIKRSDGTVFKTALTRNLKEFEYITKISASHAINSFDEISQGIYYLNLNKVSYDELNEKIPLLAHAKGLVIDVRSYPKWQTIQFISHLTSRPVEWMHTGIPVVNHPDRKKLFYIKDSALIIYPKPPLLTCKMYFLTGGGAISYAEDLLGIIKNYNLAKIVGEPTAGSTGNTNNVFLLGGLFTPLTGMNVTTQKGKQFNTRGIMPDYVIKSRIEDIRLGRDALLEFALNKIKN